VLIIAALGLMSSLPARDLQAIESYPNAREAFVFGIGLGWGNAGANLTTVEKVDRENGIAGDLLLGWAVRNNIILGAEFDIWSQFFDDERWVFNLSAVALTYYPAGGLFVSGGFGIGTSRVEFAGSGGENIVQDSGGLGYSLAGGYEFRILEDIALAPKVKWAYLEIDGNTVKNVDYVTVTIQLTWYMPQE
jgi:hypothetical protein